MSAEYIVGTPSPFSNYIYIFKTWSGSSVGSRPSRQTCNLSRMHGYYPCKILIVLGKFWLWTVFCRKDCFCRILRSFSHTFSCPQANLGESNTCNTNYILIKGNIALSMDIYYVKYSLHCFVGNIACCNLRVSWVKNYPEIISM